MACSGIYFRRLLMNASRSSGEIRTRRPKRCDFKFPWLIWDRTHFVQAPMMSAASATVNSFRTRLERRLAMTKVLRGMAGKADKAVSRGGVAPDGADRRVEGWIGSDRHRSSEARRRSDDAGQVRSGIGFSLL
jgi:hypothetical protein